MLLDPDRCVIVILTLCLVTAVQQVCSLADLVAVNEDGTVEGRSNGQIGPGDGQAVLVRARRAALSLSQADKDGALALHNSLRASVNGSNLKHMVSMYVTLLTTLVNRKIYMNLFTLRVPLVESIVCYFHTFEINLGIKRSSLNI